jgi:hypothetical protein
VTFRECHFQPTQLSNSSFSNIAFIDCEFERIEIEGREVELDCRFVECRVDSLVIQSEEECVYDPSLIQTYLAQLGAEIGEAAPATLPNFEADERLKIVERILRSFLRHSHIDDEGIRIRLGKSFTSKFYDDILPALLDRGILEEVPWRGQGVQKRYKLAKPMADLGYALERSCGRFDDFLSILGA